MNHPLKKTLRLLLVCLPACFAPGQKVVGQITIDSQSKKAGNVPNDLGKGQTRILSLAQLIEGEQHIQKIMYSDSFLYQARKVATAFRERMGNNHPYYAFGLTNLAIPYMYRGEYEKALPLYQQSLKIMKGISAENNPIHAILINNLALLYERLGQYKKALSLYRQALAIRKKTWQKNDSLHSILYTLSLGNMGAVYIKMGDYKNALLSFRQVLKIRKDILGAEHPYYALGLSNLARLYSVMGRYEQALPLFRQALEVYGNKLSKNDVEYVTGLENLALLYKDMGRYDQALPLLLQVSVWRKSNLGEEHPLYAASLNNLGLLSALTGDSVHASALFVKAGTIILEHLYRSYSTLSEQEKMAFLNQEYFSFNYLPSLAFSGSGMHAGIFNQIYASELALKGMVLENQQQVLRHVRQSGDTGTLRLYKQWRSNKSLLGEQALLLKIKRKAALDSIEENTNQAEQELSRRSEAFRNLQHMRTLTVKDVSKKLAGGQAAVEFLRFTFLRKKRTDSVLYAALVVLPGDSNARFVPLCEEKELLRVLRPSANANASVFRLYPPDNLVNKTGSGDRLYQLVWKPLEKHLNGIHTVYYAPAGVLHRIAFQALRPDPDHLLIDNYRLAQLLSTRSVALAPPTTQKLTSTGIWGHIRYDLQPGTGDVVSRGRGMDSPSQPEADTSAAFFNLYAWDRASRGGAWKPLPATKMEMDSIRNVLLEAGIQVVSNSGAEATEEQFKALDGKSPQILHLATHGFFLPVTARAPQGSYQPVSGNNVFTVQQNPMFRSGLVLAGANHAWNGGAALPGREDGILTAYEIAQMDLSNTDLLVLSACETALGDLLGNEGVIGLQRAFKMAGVKQMILSLWRVPDKETMVLMTRFYKNRLSGQPAREALRSAQLMMKEKYPPYYWAAFVMVE